MPLHSVSSNDVVVQQLLLFRVIEYYQQQKSPQPIHDLFRQRFVEGYGALLAGLLLDDIEAGLFKVWGQVDLKVPYDQFQHPGIPMTQDKLAIADTLITAFCERHSSLSFLLTMSAPPALIAFYALDHSLAIPERLDHITFWHIVALEIQELEGKGLVYSPRLKPGGAMYDWKLPPVQDHMPPECVQDSFGDPAGVCTALYLCLRPRTPFPAPRATFVFKTLEVVLGIDDIGTAVTMTLRGKLFMCTTRRRREDLGSPEERGAHALLDAAASLAHLWSGHAVRIITSSAGLRDELNDITPSRPAVSLLHALGRRFCFEPIGALAPADYSPVRSMESLAQCNSTSFGRCGISVEVLDALLMDATAAVDRDRSLLDGTETGTHLEQYQRLVVDAVRSRSHAMYNAYEPGVLYRRMREEQRVKEEEVGLEPRVGYEVAKGVRAWQVEQFWEWKDGVDARRPFCALAVGDRDNGDAVCAMLSFEPGIREEDIVLHNDEARLLARDKNIVEMFAFGGPDAGKILG